MEPRLGKRTRQSYPFQKVYLVSFVFSCWEALLRQAKGIRKALEGTRWPKETKHCSGSQRRSWVFLLERRRFQGFGWYMSAYGADSNKGMRTISLTVFLDVIISLFFSLKAIINFAKRRAAAKANHETPENIGIGIVMAIGLFCLTVSASCGTHQVMCFQIFRLLSLTGLFVVLLAIHVDGDLRPRCSHKIHLQAWCIPHWKVSGVDF